MSELISLSAPRLPVKSSAGTRGRDRLSFSIARHEGKAQSRSNPLEEIRSLSSQLVKSFNTWSFKREQPDSLATIQQAAAKAVAEQRALSFVLYWGKGPRDAVATADLVCLDYLALLAARIRQVYAAGAAIHLIQTDTHATLNGHSQEAQDAYFGAIAEAAAHRDFTTSRLSTVVSAALPAIDIGALEQPADDVLESLVACAAKWFRGEGSVEQGALEYYRMNMVEKRAIEVAFRDSVFVTFNGSEFRDLFPQAMPIFYMYSLRRGFSVKPWFIDAEPTELLQAS